MYYLIIGSLNKCRIDITKALEEFPNIAHYDMRFSKPLDEKLLHTICTNFKQIVTLEEGVKKGGFGSGILEFIGEHDYKNKVIVLGIQDHFVEHGTIEELQKMNGIDINSIKKMLRSLA